MVLDTNIYIAAFGHPKGRNATLWAAALGGRYRLLVSPAIVRELARVLRTDLQWQEEYVQSRIRIVAQVAELVSPRAALQVVTADPTDDRILECAVHGVVAEMCVEGTFGVPACRAALPHLGCLLASRQFISHGYAL